jgi:hypothetical protein
MCTDKKPERSALIKTLAKCTDEKPERKTDDKPGRCALMRT